MEVRFFFSDFICDFSTLLPTLLLRPKKLTFKNRWFAVFCMERTVKCEMYRQNEGNTRSTQVQFQILRVNVGCKSNVGCQILVIVGLSAQFGQSQACNAITDTDSSNLQTSQDSIVPCKNRLPRMSTSASTNMHNTC